MLTYLVEDDPLKMGRLVSFISGRHSSLMVRKFASFQSGLRAVEELVPELLILDMTLPTFDRSPGQREGRLRPLGGYEFMRKLKLRNVELAVVIVSQFEYFGEGNNRVTFAQITETCRREFPHMFLGSVHFRQAVDTWKDELSSLICTQIGAPGGQDSTR